MESRHLSEPTGNGEIRHCNTTLAEFVEGLQKNRPFVIFLVGLKHLSLIVFRACATY